MGSFVSDIWEVKISVKSGGFGGYVWSLRIKNANNLCFCCCFFFFLRKMIIYEPHETAILTEIKFCLMSHIISVLTSTKFGAMHVRKIQEKLFISQTWESGER